MVRKNFNYVQFWVGFVFAFGVCFVGMPLFESAVGHIATTLCFALGFAFLAGKYGDEAWKRWLHWLPW